MRQSPNYAIKGYELRERIGAGGFGEVYRAYQPSVGREVAIKVILPHLANQPDFVRRFEAEAQIIARLEHPHIVPLYDFWRDPEGAYLVMRWLPNNLRAALKRGAWSAVSVGRFLDQIAAALSVAHRDNVVHRDIKPDNILLDEDQNAYLADFGIAKDLSLREAEDDGIAGSPAYWSPEQIRSGDVTQRTDIYTLGFVLYEMLTGEQPFPDALTPSDYIQRHLNTPIPPISPQRKHIPAALDAVLQTATAKDPAQRYANAQRLAAAFNAALPSAAPRIAGQPLADALTERELEVLRLIAAELTNEQIAEKLVLSPDTIKWYVKQIYSKLDVHSRHQAIERAKQLGFTEQPRSAAVALEIENSATVLKPLNGIEPTNPYKGLRAFQEADAADFFGRAALVERLLNHMSEQDDGTHAGARFLAVIGPSGSGKSSVVKAGLIPALRQGTLSVSPRPFIAEMLPGTHPLEELEAALLRVAVNPLPSLLEQLREDRRGLVRAAKRVLPTDAETELILVIDQFEELFTLVEDEETRAHFIDNLLSAVSDPRGRVRVVLTLRADFYDRPLLYPRLAEMVRSHTELVLPLSSRELEQAITAPVERIGVQLEAGLLATIVNEVGEQPGALPLLQYALTELFERREGLVLTVDAYQASGGVLGALARRAEELYNSLSAAGQSAAQQLFLRLVTLGEGTEDTRRRALQSELLAIGDDAALMEDVIGTFSEYRLLTLDRDPISRSPTVEVAHEALIRQWDRLRDWLMGSREDIRLQRSLAQAAAEWETANRDQSYLLSGTRLAQFETWQRETTLNLIPQERTYLAVSIEERERQAHEETQRKVRETRLEQRSRLFLRALAVVLLLATLGSLALTGVAINQGSIAQTERDNAQANFRRAEQQRLYLTADEAMDNNAAGNVGMALALRSLAYGYIPGADAALMRASRQGMPVLELTGHQFELSTMQYSSDGSRIILSSEGGARVYDTATGEQVLLLEREGITRSALYSPDGSKIVTANESGGMAIWDAADGTLLQTFMNDEGSFYAHFTPDGEQVVSWLINGYAIWDVESASVVAEYPYELDDARKMIGPLYLADGAGGQRLLFAIEEADNRFYLQDPETEEITCTLLEAGDPAYEMLYWADSSPMAVFATDEHIAYGWNLETCTPLGQYAGHSVRIWAADYDPVRNSVVTADDNGMAVHWDLSSGQEFGRYYVNNRTVVVDISPDGNYLAMPDWNIGMIWDMNFPQQPQAVTLPQEEDSSFPQFSPDGQSLYVGGFGTYARWNWNEDGAGFTHALTYEQPIRTLAISADGQQLLITHEDLIGEPINSAYLIDAETGETLREFPGHTDGLNFVDISPDGTRAATSSFDLTARIWDTETGDELHVLNGHSGVVSSVVFSPDGSRILTTSSDGTVRIWDAETGESLHVVELGAPIPYADFSADGSQIAAGDTEGFAYIIDAETSEIVHNLVGHTDTIWSTKYSPDGSKIVTASWDGTARIWDAATGALIRVLDDGTRTALYWAEFSPDGDTVVSSGAESDHFNLWRVDLDETVALLCSRPILNLTAEQRVQYAISDDDAVCP